jgi:hypothetical protein
MILPPVDELEAEFGYFFAEIRSCGRVALRVLKDPMVSMSITVLKAFADRPEIGARKFPAAPALRPYQSGPIQSSAHNEIPGMYTYITKSIPPSSLTHRSTALSKLSIFLTSTAPIPITFAPFRAVAMFFAMVSVFSIFLPMIQASAPRCTRARTCALL